MNKKYYYGLFAAGMLFATSCSNDELTQVQSGEYAEVSISLGVEEVAGSRAIGDGSGADELYYSVFDADGNRITTIQQVHRENVDFPTTETITLAKGQTYKVAFWAQNKACQAYTVSPEMNVTVDYDGVNNDETRDAFFKTVEFTVNGSTALDVELTRPFAQINVGVDAADWNAAVASGVEIEESNVTIENAATSINLVTGKVDGSVKVEYTTEAIPAEPLKANNSTYNWLSMSYILVNDGSETGNAETTLKSLKYTFTPKLGNPITFKDGLNNVPVKRNWRTNILGKILTGDITFNISIDPIYEGDKNYPDGSMEQQLEMAATFGGTVTLTENVTLTAPLTVGADMILNLNGKTISGEVVKGDGAVVKIAKGVTAKIFGGGVIKSTNNNGAAAIDNAGKLTLKDVKIEGAPLANDGYSAYAVISSGNLFIEEGTEVSAYRGCLKFSGDGETVINGGKFTNNDIDPRTLTSHVVDVENGGTHLLTINGGTFQHLYAKTSGGVVICNRTMGTVYVNGGNFSGGNYYGNNNLSDYGYGGTFSVKGGTYTAKPADKYIASGYHAINYDNKYVVVSDDITAIAKTAEELAAALTATDENIHVILQNDIDLPIASLGDITAGSGEYKLGGEKTKTITIDLNGHNLNVTTTYWSNLGAKNDDALFTIKNGTMTSSQATGTWNSYDVTFSNCNYVIENVVFEKAIAFDNTGKSVSLKDVTINETHDYYAMWITANGQNVTIDGLKINSAVGRGIKIDEQYVKAPKKVTLNINNATFKTEKKAAIVVKSVAGAEINASYLYIDEVTEDNYFAVWVDEDAATYADNVVVNGAFKAVEGKVVTVGNGSTTVSEAIAKGVEYILLANDVEFGDKITNDATINLNNNTFKATGTINLNNNTDLTMIGGDYVVNGTYGHVDVRPSTTEGSVVTYENVNFSYNKLEKTYGPSTNRLGTVVEVCATEADAHTKIMFKNCTFDNAQVLFEGLSGKTGTFEAIFENCTFNALTYSAPVDVQNYVKGTIKMTGCTFNLTCTSSTASAISVSPSNSTSVIVTAENNTLNAFAATPYTYDAGKGETEVHNVKVNGTPKNIKFISISGTASSATETGTIKTGIAQ